MFKSFREFIKKNRNKLTVKGTSAYWPYNYNNNIGYLVTMDNVTQYFYFNSEGKLLQRKTIGENR